eukprot:528664_1
MEYQLNPLNLSKIMATQAKCFWIELSSLLTTFCDGTCNNNISLFTYNQSLDFDIYLNTSNESNDREMEIILCEARFDTINDTDDTLDQIDAIFQSILSGFFNRKQIYKVLNGPYTELRDGLKYDCTKPFSIIKLKTYILVESGIESKSEFDELFDNNGKFIKEAQKLLTQFFGIQVILKPISMSTINKISKGLKTEYVSIIIVFILFICVISIFMVRYSYRQQQIKSMEIRNPMVIVLGIGDYEHSKSEPFEADFSGHCVDLDGIEFDVQHVHQLFAEKLKYDVYPQLTATIQTSWTKDEIVKLLNTSAQEFSENEGKLYDGLVVIISGHGYDSKIITSDYKLLAKDNIHRLFTHHYPTVRKLPRIFIFDVCDGDNEKVIEARGNTDIIEAAKNGDIIEEEKKDDRTSADIDDKHREDNVLWALGEKNPDYRLVLINSANKNFQSFINMKKGSNLILSFVKKMENNIFNNGNRLFLSQIMNEIQDELHDKKYSAQLITCTFHNRTGDIKFYANEKRADKHGIKGDGYDIVDKYDETELVTDDECDNNSSEVIELVERLNQKNNNQCNEEYNIV